MQQVKGMPFHGKWIGAFGSWDIPPAIDWLARKAQQAAERPPFNSKNFSPWWEDPYFLVVQEWGVWRDEQGAATWPH